MKAIYPGSFNPIHKGHQQVIDLALKMFDEVYIVIAQNPDKPVINDLDYRINCIKDIYKDDVKIIVSNQMTGRVASDLSAIIVKGVRNILDFQNELDQASFNRNKFGVETILIPSSPELNYMSSSLIREINKYNESL